ncbi:MAG: deoxyguanosinetriphosphate triphosphohydrolase [Rickettsiaceae bacterium H1]|nr:deoxyguanosinetriphosphate triphosphohydrolase [Rickettsiaceae bacterium H1]
MNLVSIKSDFNKSKGRLHKEKEDRYRTPFQRDRDRIIHSGVFRKLEYKTQVFINHEGDYYRTRLTHSLEVAQIARAICERLNLSETLGEAIALAHDFGHTPFGHAGEESLRECTENYGGFDHNAQSLRVLTFLEQRYASFDGMNLTWEVLEGVAKHNGPITIEKQHKIISRYNKLHDLELDTFAGPEAQVASIADDIAYNAHDIDDGIRSGLIGIKDMYDIPYIAKTLKSIEIKYPKIVPERLIHEFLSKFIAHMINDVVTTTNDNLRKFDIKNTDEVRKNGQVLVCFSQEFSQTNKMLKSFLSKNLYHHYKVNRIKSKTKQIVKDLFQYFHTKPECLPLEWHKKINSASSEEDKVLVICDFISGMTDRFAIQEHKQLLGSY